MGEQLWVEGILFVFKLHLSSKWCCPGVLEEPKSLLTFVCIHWWPWSRASWQLFAAWVGGGCWLCLQLPAKAENLELNDPEVQDGAPLRLLLSVTICCCTELEGEKGLSLTFYRKQSVTPKLPLWARCSVCSSNGQNEYWTWDVTLPLAVCAFDQFTALEKSNCSCACLSGVGFLTFGLTLCFGPFSPAGNFSLVFLLLIL